MRRLLLLSILGLAICLFFAACAAEELTMGVNQPDVFAAAEAGARFTSSDEKIATVNPSSGKISALRPGECEIYGEKDGNTVYTLSLTVLKAPTKLYVDNGSVEMMASSYALPQECRARDGEYLGPIDVKIDGDTVKLSSDGRLYAASVGSSMVYLRAYNGAFVKYEIKVRTAPAEISLDAESASIGVGEKTFFGAALSPSYSFSRILWSSSDESVADIDENGLIIGVGTGVCEIYAATENGLSASATVYILPLPEALNTPETIRTAEGLSGSFESILPNGTYADFTYESLTPDTVSVSDNGTWIALKGGEGIARLYAVGTDLFVDQRFEILPLPKTLSISCESTTLYPGLTAQATAEVSPLNSYGEVSWTSSNPSLVAVSESGLISAKAAGSAVITASTPNALKASITIKVNKSPTGGIALNKTHIELNAGESYELKCAFPGGAEVAAEYVSLDPSIASIDPETGLVLGVSRGSTVVVASGLGLEAGCLVTVFDDGEGANTELEIIFMDVDSNDSIILRSGDEYAFIDSGNHIYGEKAASFLKELGINHLKYYIGTHAHLDHIGGACVILDNFDVDMVIVPHEGVIRAINNCVWTQSEREAVQKASFTVLSHGESFSLGGAFFKCIGPIGIKNVDNKDNDENSNSLVLRVEVGDVSMLLTGDGTVSEFNAILQKYPDELKVDVFKNTHHSGELSEKQIRAISPKITIFSTSSLHLPREKYLSLLTSLGSEIYMTPTRVNGNITLYTNGKDIIVTPEFEDNRGSWYNEITGKPK